jgi:Domain of unknown function (DUF4105)
VRLLLPILLGVILFSADISQGQVSLSLYLDELIGRAHDLSLHEQRYWHLLLRYRATWAGHYDSEIDAPGFFLSTIGKTDPKAELDATLRAFFSAELVGRTPQPARCAFIARYEWLKSALSIDENRLPAVSCERFQSWLHDLNPDSITLIFPSSFINNPASMFGHLLLRIDQKGQTEATRILAYTINYAADLPPDTGLEFAVLGIFGGYTGFYSTIPYYLKAKEYGDFENRDIWEYRLNFSQTQVHRLLMHAWELGSASFDYFFFRENCAYHMLALLDVADPELRLAERFWLYTLPSDGVRAIAEKPGLVQAAVFRPSRRTKILRGRDALSDTDRDWLGKIIDAPSLAQSPEFHQLPAERRAAVLDVASDYLLYKAATDNQPNEFASRNSTVLLARSDIKSTAPALEYRPISGPPDQGHRVLRAGLGVGWRDREFFGEASFRLAFHDLLDPEFGYTPDAQIEALSIALRHYPEHQHTRIERLTLLNIMSLSPVDSLFFKPSWRFNTGLETIHRNGCRYCRVGGADGGIGLAAESSWLRREVYYVFTEAAAEYSRAFASDYRVGAGLLAGTLVDITDRWKIAASVSYFGYPAGDGKPEWRVGAQQRFTLTKDLALRFDFNQRLSRQEYLLNLHFYF